MPKIKVKPPFWQRKSPENQWFSGLGGGDKRDRTADLLNAIQALSQLSYTPKFSYAVGQLLYYSTDPGFVKRGFALFLCLCKVVASIVLFCAISDILRRRKQLCSLLQMYVMTARCLPDVPVFQGIWWHIRRSDLRAP